MRNKWFKGGIVAVVLMVGASLYLTAGGKKEEKAAGMKEKAEKVEITLWCMAFEPHVDGFNNCIDEFEDMNPNIDITLEPQPGQAEMVSKMRSALSAKKGPQGFTTTGTTILEWAVPGNLQPVSPDVVTVEQVKREQLPENWLQCPLEGKIWAIGIPDSPGDIGLAANVDHLNEVGLPVISKFDTMDQLLQYGKKLAKYEKGKLVRGGVSFQEPNDPMFFYSFIVDQGGKFWDNDTQKFTLQTPEARKALQFIRDLFYKYELDSVELPDTLSALGQNLSSMGFVWAEFVYFSELIYPDLNFTFIMKPAFTGTKPAVFNHTDTWNVVVPNYVEGKEKEAMFEFLRYLISEQGQLTFLTDGYTGLSPLKSIVFDHEYYKTGPGKSMAPVIDAMQKGSYMYYGPFIDADVMLYDIMWPIMDSVIHNQISIDDALKQMETELNDRNARTMAKYSNAPKTIIDWDGLEITR
jgi:ABC-type glycerol-3-phosphate transport system substrate-binding protein